MSVVPRFFKKIMTKFKLACMALTLSLAATASTWAFATETLVAADKLPTSHAFVQTVDYFGTLTTKNSKGTLTVSVQANGALGSEAQTLRAVQEGRVAMVRVNLGILADRMHSAELLSLPYLFRSEEHLNKVLRGPFGARLDRELADNGYVRLMYLYGGPRNLFCTKPIYGVSDLKGVRIRTLESRAFTEMTRDLGAIPVQLPINRTADAFQNHQIDCAGGNLDTYISEALYRYAPYLIQDEHARVPDVLLISKKVWDRLTPAQQNLLHTSADAAMAQMLGRLHEGEEANLKTARKEGATPIAHAKIANNAIEEQAARFYNHIVTNDQDLDAVMQIVMTR